MKHGCVTMVTGGQAASKQPAVERQEIRANGGLIETEEQQRERLRSRGTSCSRTAHV